MGVPKGPRLDTKHPRPWTLGSHLSGVFMTTLLQDSEPLCPLSRMGWWPPCCFAGHGRREQPGGAVVPATEVHGPRGQSLGHSLTICSLIWAQGAFLFMAARPLAKVLRTTRLRCRAC